ncbi:hypothetical protein SAMN06265370_11937 [Puniceibacterium sediminis]|uniref:Uncharacterized protein n=1 Tax=Puniceibacterium sediminis TaxID=1608407 RepID=A0A238YPV9_9RHOB|nr:hypothetical protein SAMN06265370_11937 [Puniceibacterium sediminis]
MKGETETAPPVARPVWLDAKEQAQRTELYEIARLRFPGFDIYFVEGEWRGWAAGKAPAQDQNFLAFTRSLAEKTDVDCGAGIQPIRSEAKAPAAAGNTTVLSPFRKTRLCTWACTARDSTCASTSRPRET